ncbi:hypothetical protein DL765_000390 [Monosporascus sp. GIB2]|nr:hypothetical protein DL765_000390 [Monosporascus sp. GIB2]
MLLTDLLWFAIEGPGERLYVKDDIPVAPTWSWASIKGAVALDLLPETSISEIEETKALVTIEHVATDNDEHQQMSIMLSGPLLPISAPTLEGTTWVLDVGETGKPSARVFPDVAFPDISQMPDLFCLSFLVLNREKIYD